MSYYFRLTARVLLYAPSHRQHSTHHGLCYTSRGALAGTKNSSMDPTPCRIDPTTHRTMSERSYHGATSRCSARRRCHVIHCARGQRAKEIEVLYAADTAYCRQLPRPLEREREIFVARRGVYHHFPVVFLFSVKGLLNEM